MRFRLPLYACVVLLGVPAIVAGQDYCIPGRFTDTIFPPEAIRYTRNIEYGRNVDWLGEEDTLLLDIYEPKPLVDTLPLRPLIVNIHGGGFHGGSKSNDRSVYEAGLFARMGFVVSSIDYRVGWNVDKECMGDTTEFMMAVYRAQQDVRAAIRFLKFHAEDYRIDTNRVYVLGSSAGAASAIILAYYRQSDFGTYLREALGLLDDVSNDLNGPSTVVHALITRSGSTNDVSYIDRGPLPHLLFHGTCDLTVPYFEGPVYWCYGPNPYPYVYGSGDMAVRYETLGACHWLYRSVNAGHSAVSADTLIATSSRFLKALLCGECESRHLEDQSGQNQCEQIGEIPLALGDVYPNPSAGRFNLRMEGHEDGRVELDLYDVTGRLIRAWSVTFTAPVSVIEVDAASVAPGIYFLRVGKRRDTSVLRVLVN